MRNLTEPKAILIAALIGIFGIAIGAFLNPIASKWINQPEPTPNPTSLAIEQIHGNVLTYDGEEINLSGKANLRLLIGGNNPNYILVYELPSSADGYVGLVFEFNNGINVSEYTSIDFVIKFDGPNQETRLYLQDISDKQSFERILSSSDSEMNMSFPLSNFADPNMNAIKRIKFDVNAQFGNGLHEIIVKEIRFSR